MAEFLEIYMRHDAHYTARLTPKQVCFITAYPVSDLCPSPLY